MVALSNLFSNIAQFMEYRSDALQIQFISSTGTEDQIGAFRDFVHCCLLFCCIYCNRYQISATFCKGEIIPVPQDSMFQNNVTFLRKIKFFFEGAQNRACIISYFLSDSLRAD
ncbi:hypothetical protein OIU77_015434, partial [Salix suchowensis]